MDLQSLPYVVESKSEIQVNKHVIKKEDGRPIYILLLRLKGSNFLWLSNSREASLNNLGLSILSQPAPTSSLLLGEMVTHEYTIQLSGRLARRYNISFYVSVNLIEDNEEHNYHVIEMELRKYLDGVLKGDAK